jgi:N-methylhydantoinase A/oxoprolinase/acetone carboxylase beta subunit
VRDDQAQPVEADILWRPGLAAGTQVAGPAVIEERNSTTFVPPGDHAMIDSWGNIVITLGDRVA